MKDIIYNKFDLQLLEEPYADNYAYLQDFVKLLDIKLYFYLRHIIKIKETGESRLDKYKGLLVGREEIIGILDEIAGKSGHDQELSGKAEQEYLESLPLLEAYLEQRKMNSIKKGIFLPFGYLTHVFKLSNFEQHCVILSLLNRIDRKYEKIFGYLQDDVTLKNPTSDLAIKLYSPKEAGAQVIKMLYVLEQKLFKYFFAEMDSIQHVLSKPFLLDKRIQDFIFDFQTTDEKIDRFLSVYYPGDELPELTVQGQVQESLNRLIGSQEGNCLIFCHGPRGVGKKLQLKTLACMLKKPIVFADSKAIIKEDYKLDMVNLHKTVREVLLQDSFLCLTNFEDVVQDVDRFEEVVLELLGEISRQVNIVLITSRQYWQLKKKSSDYQWYEMELSLPGREDRSILWEKFIRKDEIAEEVDYHELANKFQFTPGQIVNGLEEARQTARWKGNGGQISREVLYKACYKQISHNLDKKATLVFAKYKMDDLVLPRVQKQSLINACNQIKYRHVVFDRWGFENKLPYGKGISMLFTGPPGTGKTTAAQVIAFELGMEMYKIDLSQVVSKYIGETEKNLKEVFDEAAKSSAILFFDECDSILGKRTEVKDSHDKYANIETSFLLQKVEEFEGVSILATNLLANIDGAFLRRISHVIHFPFPDESSREKIWRIIFPDQTPLAGDVNFGFLAKQFELAGGSIKNIAVNASFLAAAEQTKVSMRHLLLALKDELTKHGKSVVSSDFGEYAFYIK